MIILFPVQETRQNPHSAPMRPKAGKGDRDNSQALTGRSLCVRAGFSLHCQPCQRAKGEPSQSRGAESLADLSIFCANFPLQFFVLVFSARE